MSVISGKIKSAAALVAVVLAATLSVGCNSLQSETVADHHVGPAGPTYPSSYYFDVTVTPHTIQGDGTTTVIYKVRVWDSNGNIVSGASVAATGADTSAVTATGYDGIASFILEVKATGTAKVLYMTFSLEDSSLTIPLQELPFG